MGIIRGSGATVASFSSSQSTLGRANVVVSAICIGNANVNNCVVSGAVTADAFTGVPLLNNGYAY